MKTGKLTDVLIRKLKPGEKTCKISDGGGLFLQVEPKGGKLWRYSYQFEGKQKTLALGKYPDISLQMVRNLHREARERLAHGTDPAAAKRAQKNAGEERAANSFEVVAREWFETWRIGKSENTYSKVIARLEKDVFPYIGAKPIAEIKPPEILEVLRRIESRGVVETAHKAKYSIQQAYDYAVSLGKAGTNPCRVLHGVLKPIRAEHFPSITEPAKVAELLRAIDAYKGYPIVRAALRLAPLVFVRPGELRAARWGDIDLDHAEWKYVTSKTKTEHHVPLAKQAVEILRELYPLTGHGEYVFPSFRSGRTIADATINRALQTMGYDTAKEMTFHGFRAMARTLLAERLHFPAEIIEHQLAHKVPDALGTAYNRTKFLDQRKAMMQVWSDYLDKLKVGTVARVVPFPAAG
jgi:integrase